MSKKHQLKKNQFFDINKLPTERGILVFGLSMNKLSAGEQSPSDILEYLRIFQPSKISVPLVGASFIYSDFLYLNSDFKASVLKKNFMHSIINHKNALEKLINKNNHEFQIREAFSSLVWNQLYLGTKDFSDKLNEVKRIYQEDKVFQKYIKEDSEYFSQEVTENQINFFLEEILMFYLMQKGQVRLPNDFIRDLQKWVLFCYPGKPLKSTAYFFQLNPFDLHWKENPYENCQYDLLEKKLYDFDNMDLETWER